MKHYFAVLQKYAVFDGRAGRAEFWYFFLFNTLLSLTSLLVDFIIGTTLETMGLLQITYGVIMVIPGLAVMMRRLHDTDRSGFWIWIAIIPIVGPIALFIVLARKGTEGENRYGAGPGQMKIA